jgi:uncharacterized protein (DUF1697 family)
MAAPSPYIAFLRGINLGQRRIKMDELRRLFGQLKFAEVETFIASGNVIFASKSADPHKIENQIQAHLKKALGYDVDTFVRTRAEVAAIAACQCFAASDLAQPNRTVHVGFLREALDAEQIRNLLACRTPVDEFSVAGREFYWLCRIKSHESKAWTSAPMRAVKMPSTSLRNLTTVRKLAAHYPASSEE